MKKALLLCLGLLLCLCLLSCAQEVGEGAEPEATPGPTAAEAPAGGPAPVHVERRKVSTSNTLVGFIVPDTLDIASATLKHGFLRTAENLGFPGKLYLADVGAASTAAVEQAAAEGCKGLLVWSPEGANATAIARARELSIPVVSPYHRAEGAHANVVADVNGYMEEVALGVAERMVERECQAGRILVYGRDTHLALAGFTEAIQTYYPQYTVSGFSRRANDQAGAIGELATYLLWNRDVKGLFCLDADGALVAVRAREEAQRLFRDGAPEAAEGAMPPPGVREPGATPAPEGLTKSITISVAGYGFSADTVALMRTNDIYAFVMEPYYEASAQSLMLLDRILSGESVPEASRLNMPIVRSTTLEKYVLIDEQVRKWFQLEPLVNTQ